MQWLLARGISCEAKAGRLVVPQRERVHAIEVVGEFLAPFPPPMKQHFRVTVIRDEVVSLRFQLLPQFAVVVDAAVERDGEEVVGIACDRFVAHRGGGGALEEEGER